MNRSKGVSSPRRQGSLDGMCGVYSVVNAIKLCANLRLKDHDLREIFFILCKKLEEEGRLADVLKSGMSVQILGRIIDAASSHTIEKYGFTIRRRLAFRSDPDDLEEYWINLKLHIKEVGPGSAIIGISGKHDHWSCVRKMSPRSIQLEDSDGLSRLLRSRCTISDPTVIRQHRLCPTETYFLFVE